MNPYPLSDYRKNGFCVLPQVMPPEVLEEIHREAKSVFDIQIRKNGLSDGNYADEREFEHKIFELFKVNYDAFLGCAKAAQHIMSLLRLGVDDLLIDRVKDIGVEFPTVCVKPIVYFNSRHLAKIEAHYKTPAHQDWRSMQGSLNSVVVWIPLVDIDKDLGAVEFLPESHRNGLLPTEKDDWFEHILPSAIDESKFFPAEVKRGDMVLFSAFCAHRSGNNITDRIRWSVHFRYNDAREPSWIDRNLVHPYRVYHPYHEIQTPGFPQREDLDAIFG